MAEDFDTMFRNLQRDYLASLPERLKDTRAAIEKVRGSADETAADAARESFHKLRGTGTSFGLPEVSEAAARGENAMLAYRSNRAADVWGELEDALKILEAAVARGV